MPNARGARALRLRTPLVAAAAVFVLCLAVTVAAWVWTRDNENREHDAKFVTLTDRYARELTGQLESYRAVLRGAVGLCAATGTLSAATWRAYVSQLDLPRHYPGLRALGYLQRVRSADLPGFLARRRADDNPSFEIRPPGARADYVPVTYAEPPTRENLAALGLDHMEDAVRRAALMRARDDADVALSGVLTMPGDAVGRSGMLMELPVYGSGASPPQRTQRAQALTGYVVGAFRLQDLMSLLTARYGDLLSVRITDRTDTVAHPLLFASQSAQPDLPPEFHQEATLHFGGRVLHLNFSSEPAFGDGLDHHRSTIIALGGGALALMFTLLVWHFGSGRNRALAYAREMTSELRTSEQRFELVVRGSVGGIWDHDFGTGTVYLSPRVEDMLGYAAGTLERAFEALVMLIHPVDRAAARNALRAHLVYQEPFDVEVRLTKGDGSLGWFRLRGQAQWDEAGKPQRMAGSFDDITAEHEAEQKVERSQAFLTRIIDNLPDPFVVKSRDLRIIVANQAYSRFLGLPLDRIIGRRSAEILPDGRGVEVERLDLAAFDSGDPLMEPLDVTDGADQVHHVIVKKVPCAGPDGGPALIGMFMDVTAEREALARFESILENTPMVAVVGLDRQGFVLHLNPAAAWLYGHAAAEVIGRPLQAFITREDPAGEAFALELDRVWRSGLPIGPMERRVRLFAGEPLWVFTTLFPVFRHGEVAEVFCMDVDITARKAAEDALQAERALFVTGPTMVFKWRAEPRWLVDYVSPNVERELGHAVAALMDGSQPFADLVHPDDIERVSSAVDALTHGRVPHLEQEYRLRNAHGDYRWMQSFIVVERDGAGAVSHYHGYLIDQEERKRADRHLRESEARWQFALEGSGDGVWDWDVAGDRVFYSPRWKAILGYAEDEIGDTLGEWERRVHADDLPQTYKEIQDHLVGKTQSCESEYRILCKDGSYKWVVNRSLVVSRTEDGMPARIIGTHADITERKQAQLQLEESERRFRLMSDSAPVMIWVADTDQSCTYVNRTWRTFTGEGGHPSVRDGWLELVHTDDRPRYRGCLDQAFENRQLFECEFRMRRHDGVYRWVLDAGAPRFAGDGSFAGFVGTCADITERRDAEDALRRKRDHLQDLVFEQTAGLRVAKEAAERANESKSKFLANMSHELRTPMHAVLSYARLGTDRALVASPEKLREFFDRIHASGDRLLMLLNDLLDLSKLEAGRMVIEARPHPVAALIENARVEFEGLLVSKQLEFRVDIDQSSSHVLVEASRFAQVLRNVLSNAIKFTPHGRSVQVHVAPGRLKGDRGNVGDDWRDAVEIIVSDQGVGIPEAELEAVFDKFVQSSKTRSGAGGTGLGLAICREIVKAHRGEIYARNNAAGGADVVVLLPAAPAQDTAQHPILEREHA